jgi:hypothetical protein
MQFNLGHNEPEAKLKITSEVKKRMVFMVSGFDGSTDLKKNGRGWAQRPWRNEDVFRTWSRHMKVDGVDMNK